MVNGAMITVDVEGPTDVEEVDAPHVPTFIYTFCETEELPEARLAEAATALDQPMGEHEIFKKNELLQYSGHYLMILRLGQL